MPVHTSALLMRSQPGAELICRGHNYKLPPGEGAQPRGVLSYYATATLPAASSMSDWLARIQAQVQQDVDRGDLPGLYRLDLQGIGDSAW